MSLNILCLSLFLLFFTSKVKPVLFLTDVTKKQQEQKSNGFGVRNCSKIYF